MFLTRRYDDMLALEEDAFDVLIDSLCALPVISYFMKPCGGFIVLKISASE